MKQNYINILENEAGSITLACASCDNDDPFIMEGVRYVVIGREDLRAIGEELIHLADTFDEA